MNRIPIDLLVTLSCQTFFGWCFWSVLSLFRLSVKEDSFKTFCRCILLCLALDDVLYRDIDITYSEVVVKYILRRPKLEVNIFWELPNLGGVPWWCQLWNLLSAWKKWWWTQDRACKVGPSLQTPFRTTFQEFDKNGPFSLSFLLSAKLTLGSLFFSIWSVWFIG